jgi:hypothetical protein
MTKCVTDTIESQDISADMELSQAVVDAVADAEGVEPTELPPLFSAIDPDALDALFQPASDETVVTGSVRFRYAGYDVNVNEDGSVVLKND